MTNKILFVDNSANEFLNFRGFVAQMYIQEGHSVSLLCPPCFDLDVINEFKKNGINLYFYDLRSKKSPYEDMRLLIRLVKYYRSLKPDLIIHYTIKPNIYGSMAAKICNIPCISIIPGLGSVFKTCSFTRLFVTFLYRCSLKIPYKIWVLNHDDHDFLIKKNLVSNKEKLEILPGEGIDTAFYNCSNPYKKHYPFVFLFIGRIILEKGVKVLVEAAKLLKKRGITGFQINLIGSIDGSLSSGSIKLSEIELWEKEKLIKYIGRVPNASDFIEESDCIVLPSFYGEGLPRSLMEACSMKRIIISTDNVGCRDVVDHGVNGFLVVPKDSKSLAETMIKVMTMSEKNIRNMGEAGRSKMLASYDKEIIIRHYKKLLLEFNEK